MPAAEIPATRTAFRVSYRYRDGSRGARWVEAATVGEAVGRVHHLEPQVASIASVSVRCSAPRRDGRPCTRLSATGEPCAQHR